MNSKTSAGMHKLIAGFFLIIHGISIAMPFIHVRAAGVRLTVEGFPNGSKANIKATPPSQSLKRNIKKANKDVRPITFQSGKSYKRFKDIGGPSQPEMSSFKTVGTDNMVNLFTGDFSYNIPLMDVGGYPINIFYDGNVGMEQEASWVGLGWNINPGTVTRNMRGIPDEFDGTDELEQTQVTKPNITWGVAPGVSGGELFGIKTLSGSASLGFTLNNYLGPSLELAVSGSASLNIPIKAQPEKSPLGLSAGLGATLSSRSGLTMSPNASLTASTFENSKGTSYGVGLRLSTSYNSRSGIKELQISEQASANRDNTKNSVNPEKYSKEDISSVGESTMSSSISFAKPSYIPSMRMPLTNSSYSARFKLGGGIFGGYGSASMEIYKLKSEVAESDQVLKKPMIGYLHYQLAADNPNAVMDFTRLNDNEVTENTPIISAPQYTYDVFSIQGEGTGGNVRAYRNDLGYVRDNFTQSKDKSFGLGVDVSIVPPGHYGANVNIVKTPTTIGEWSGGNKLKPSLKFTNSTGTNEGVYFRNPGETSVLNPNQYDKIGGIDLVRFALSGNAANPMIEPTLNVYDRGGAQTNSFTLNTVAGDPLRKKRTQVISILTANEAASVGLDKFIKSYDRSTLLTTDRLLNYTAIPRVGAYRRGNHISQIDVTEADGKRYIYGIPVYSTYQKDFTFSVEGNNSPDADLVSFSSNQADRTSPLVQDNSKVDGYVQITRTPPYAHSFLLSGLLSPDYVDVKGDGITEDDLGTSVKFNYTKIATDYKWRTPLKNSYTANSNAGKRTEVKDDKGIVSYGERESWYVHSIESKTMIAIFKLQNRSDGIGAAGELTGVEDNHSKQCLRQIDLYSKSDIKLNGIGTASTNARPIKTVHFEYDYTLCNGTPDAPINTGKLTLKGVYFTYNGQARTNKNRYSFSYESPDGRGNPDYALNASDRWGTYKNKTQNPQGLRNADYPYSLQGTTQTEINTINENAGAWALKRILLPSGGQIEVQYESDDYAYVQNKRAAQMMKILGFGQTSSSNFKDVSGTCANCLYVNNGNGIVENTFVFIEVPFACTSAEEVKRLYIGDQLQLAFKMAVNMPKGMEFINSYASIVSWGVYATDHNVIWVELKRNGGISPLSLTALEFLRQQLPGQAFAGYDVSESTGLKQAGEILSGMFSALKSAFSNPLDYLRSQQKAKTVAPGKSFVRLNNPLGVKYGGGQRVKRVVLKDNWRKMNDNKSYTSTYGQEYSYRTFETIDGIQKEISSGVASYEPSLGGEENPFHTIVQVSDKLPLGPTSYGAIEMPVLDAFFPSPVVGYSKVTVKSLQKDYITPATAKSRSGVGKQVTEFYTAKDYPVSYSHTFLEPSSDKEDHQSSFGAFFYKYSFNGRALSQGFLVETNDMHGKLKSQTSYAENDENTPINYLENFYRNTGSNGMEEKFSFVDGFAGGVISKGNMGIDVELMTDTREFVVKSNGLEVQGQVDLFGCRLYGLLSVKPKACIKL
jgi:hypothetical protein